MKIWLVGNLDDSDENMLSYVGVVTISTIISPFSISTYGSHGMCCCSPQSCHLPARMCWLFKWSCNVCDEFFAVNFTRSTDCSQPLITFLHLFFSSTTPTTSNASCMTRRASVQCSKAFFACSSNMI